MVKRKPKAVVVAAWVSPELRDVIVEAAERNDRSVSAEVRRILTRHVAEAAGGIQ